MCRDASAAKRIISTAPIAKFGATNAFALRRLGGAAQRVDVEAGRPDDDVPAGRERGARVVERGVGPGEVDDDVAAVEHVRELARRAPGRRGR